jgi:allantoinase
VVEAPSERTAELELPYESRHLPFDKRDEIDVWPDGARIAVTIELTPEQWEWDRKEPSEVHGSITLPEESRQSLSSQTAVRYGMKIGLPRIWNILEERNLTATAPATGNTAVRYPETIRKFTELGHEVICHSYSEGTPLTVLDKEGQRKDINKTVDVLERTTGETPKGWLSPALLCNEDTIDILADQGFNYHCDLQDDELPYFIEKNGTTLVELPYRIVGGPSDLALYVRENRYSIDEALEYLKSVFDAHYTEAATRPQLFNVCIHPHVSGRPDASLVIEKYLDYILKHDEVWMATYGEVADWWASNLDRQCVSES